jgi:hypothetical protein
MDSAKMETDSEQVGVQVPLVVSRGWATLDSNQ